ncbi:MAG: hypothetical protein Q8S84_00505 [bacterium]|nr:hypothetical protein [bacterium]MDP3380069.1 hypothetical protein [bacterium]
MDFFSNPSPCGDSLCPKGYISIKKGEIYIGKNLKKNRLYQIIYIMIVLFNNKY